MRDTEKPSESLWPLVKHGWGHNSLALLVFKVLAPQISLLPLWRPFSHSLHYPLCTFYIVGVLSCPCPLGICTLGSSESQPSTQRPLTLTTSEPWLPPLQGYKCSNYQLLTRRDHVGIRQATQQRTQRSPFSFLCSSPQLLTTLIYPLSSTSIQNFQLPFTSTPAPTSKLCLKQLL